MKIKMKMHPVHFKSKIIKLKIIKTKINKRCSAFTEKNILIKKSM
jgi:hypothetical protein